MFAPICHAKPSLCGCELRKKAVGDPGISKLRQLWSLSEKYLLFELAGTALLAVSVWKA
jgi:hypothetical protein